MLSSLLKEVWAVKVADKISRHIPFHPYSEEMEEKIEMEEEKLRSAASMDNSYTKMLFSSNVPLIGKAWYLQVRARTLPVTQWSYVYKLIIYLHPYLRELWQGRTNSTVLLKQPNSLEVDRAELRKTKSAEHMGLLAPTIIIGQL